VVCLGQQGGLLAWRGEPTDSIMAEVDELSVDQRDPNVTQGLDDARGNVAFGQGRLSEAREAWHRVAEEGPWNVPTCLPMAATAALWSRDAGAAIADLQGLDAIPPHGRLVDARREVILAGIAGLGGRVDASAARDR